MRSKLLLYLGALIVLTVFSTRATAQDCYESSIVSPSPFMGNNGEIFKLADGSLWEVKYEYEYLYEYYPSVVICPSRGRLIVGEKSLSVELVAVAPRPQGEARSQQTEGWEIFEETSLEGSISGTVQQGRIFKTTSGRIYEVTGVTLQLVLELQPEVMVLRNGDNYRLIVEGFDEPLICKCLNCRQRGTDSSPATSQPQEPTIKAAQAALTALGFDPGTADGTLSSQTRSAVNKFRVVTGLAATDSLDAATLRSIAIALTRKYPDKSHLLTVAVYLMEASENWPPPRHDQKSPGPGTVTPKVIESYIISDFDGLDHGNIYKLANGQIWEQTEYWIWVWVWVNPKVLIWNDGGIYRMKVEGIDHPVMARRIK